MRLQNGRSCPKQFHSNQLDLLGQSKLEYTKEKKKNARKNRNKKRSWPPGTFNVSIVCTWLYADDRESWAIQHVWEWTSSVCFSSLSTTLKKKKTKKKMSTRRTTTNQSRKRMTNPTSDRNRNRRTSRWMTNWTRKRRRPSGVWFSCLFFGFFRPSMNDSSLSKSACISIDSFV